MAILDSSLRPIENANSEKDSLQNEPAINF